MNYIQTLLDQLLKSAFVAGATTSMLVSCGTHSPETGRHAYHASEVLDSSTVDGARGFWFDPSMCEFKLGEVCLLRSVVFRTPYTPTFPRYLVYIKFGEGGNAFYDYSLGQSPKKSSIKNDRIVFDSPIKAYFARNAIAQNWEPVTISNATGIVSVIEAKSGSSSPAKASNKPGYSPDTEEKAKLKFGFSTMRYSLKIEGIVQGQSVPAKPETFILEDRMRP